MAPQILLLSQVYVLSRACKVNVRGRKGAPDYCCVHTLAFLAGIFQVFLRQMQLLLLCYLLRGGWQLLRLATDGSCIDSH